MHRERFYALVLLSVVGLIVALAFARFSAPDLAMTQLSVEVVTIVLLMLALYYMPSWTPFETPMKRRVRDMVIAGLAGTGMTFATLAMLTQPFSSISDFFLQNSKPGAGGTNGLNGSGINGTLRPLEPLARQPVLPPPGASPAG